MTSLKSRFDERKQALGWPTELLCSLTSRLPVDPVIAEDGRIYEKAAIERWITNRQQKNRPINSPTTNELMGSTLIRAIQIKQLIQGMIASGAIPVELATRWKEEHVDKEVFDLNNGSTSLSSLSTKLLLHICDYLYDPNKPLRHIFARAALCLASPRIGILAIRSLASFQDPLVSVAMALFTRPASEVLTVELVRRNRDGGCMKWLKTVARRNACPIFSFNAAGALTREWQPDTHKEIIYKGRPKDEHMVRARLPDAVTYFQGPQGFERVVRIAYRDTRIVTIKWPVGEIRYFEGEKGAERIVRIHLANPSHTFDTQYCGEFQRLVRIPGSILHLDGEKGVERVVRIYIPDTNSMRFWMMYPKMMMSRSDTEKLYFEGERGAERKVCADHLGECSYFEGEPGVEHKVRVEIVDWRAVDRHVVHYEGERGAERKVRAVISPRRHNYSGLYFCSFLGLYFCSHLGHVQYFEGEAGAERLVRAVFGGMVQLYGGKRGAEHLLRTEYLECVLSVLDNDDLVQLILTNCGKNVRGVCKRWRDNASCLRVDPRITRLNLCVLASLGLYAQALIRARTSKRSEIRKALFFAIHAHKNRTAKMLKSFLPDWPKLQRKRIYDDVDHAYPKAENTVLWYFERFRSPRGQFSWVFGGVPKDYLNQDPHKHVQNRVGTYPYAFE
jgi:hypothetical protein